MMHPIVRENRLLASLPSLKRQWQVQVTADTVVISGLIDSRCAVRRGVIRQEERWEGHRSL